MSESRRDIIAANARSLKGKTILMSGGSRGIGLAIALRAAADGANVAIMAKTGTAHASLEGTVHTAAAQIEAAGGTGAGHRGGRAQRRGRARRRGADRRTLRRDRRGGQQRLRDRPVQDRRRVDEEVRPDDGHQRARHLPALQDRAAAPARERERAHPHAVPAAEPGPAVGRRAPGVHHGQVRHVADHPGAGRGTARDRASA